MWDRAGGGGGERVNGCFDEGQGLPLAVAVVGIARAEIHALSSLFWAFKRGKCCAFFSHFLALPLGPYIAIWAPGALGLTAPGSHGPWAPRAPSVQRSGMRFFLQCEGSTSWCILGWTWGDGSGSTDVLTGPGLSVGGPLRAKVPENQIG